MKELAIAAAGVFIGMVLGGVCLLPTLVRLREERDELGGAIDEWAEARRADRAAREQYEWCEGMSVRPFNSSNDQPPLVTPAAREEAWDAAAATYSRLAVAESMLRRYAEDPK